MSDEMEYEKPKNIEELKALCARSKEDGAVEGVIQLGFGALSRKRIVHTPDDEKPWWVWACIDDTEVELTDEGMVTETNILEAMQKGAFFVEANELAAA